jgi:methylmalonyl-CoA epimerase
MIKKVHHIAVAVKDLDRSLAIYTNVLGLQGKVLEMGSYSVKLAFLQVGDVLVEFIQPTSDDDPLGFAEFLRKNGEGFHHMAYEVEDIENAMDILRENGIRLIDEKPKPGADGLIAFVDKESLGGVLVELIQTRGA